MSYSSILNQENNKKGRQTSLNNLKVVSAQKIHLQNQTYIINTQEQNARSPFHSIKIGADSPGPASYAIYSGFSDRKSWSLGK